MNICLVNLCILFHCYLNRCCFSKIRKLVVRWDKLQPTRSLQNVRQIEHMMCDVFFSTSNSNAHTVSMESQFSMGTVHVFLNCSFYLNATSWIEHIRYIDLKISYCKVLLKIDRNRMIAKVPLAVWLNWTSNSWTSNVKFHSSAIKILMEFRKRDFNV